MRWTSLESAAISAIAYDESVAILQIEFTSGDLYRYFAVPPSIPRGLVEADSAGRYFQEHVRDVYPSEYVRR